MASLGESAYGRSKQEKVEETVCDSYNQNKFCLCSDSSDGKSSSVE